MNKEQLKESLHNWVKNNYNLNNYKVKEKLEHTYYVADNALELAKSLQFTINDQNLAYILGILHDFGRFEQVTNQNNYVDFKGFDHAEMGAKYLFDDGLISLFNVDKKDYNLLNQCIRQHNKLSIDKSITDTKTIIFSKLIRDADKLDMYRLNSESTNHLTLNLAGYTEEVLNSIYNNKCVNVKHRKTLLDEILGFLGTIFDLNYEYSKQNLYKTNFFNNFYNNYQHLLTNKDKTVLKNAINYVNGQLQQANNKKMHIKN